MVPLRTAPSLCLVLFLALGVLGGRQLGKWHGLRSQTLVPPTLSTLVSPATGSSQTWAGDESDDRYPSRLSCGNWQAEYAALHADILAGRSAPRYVITAHSAGLADNLVADVSAFYFALLTGRAFQMGFQTGGSHPMPHQPDYLWAYEQPNINWTVPETIIGLSDNGFDGPLKEGQVGNFGPSTYAVSDLSYRSQEAISKKWMTGDVVSIGEGYETVFLFHTQGVTMRLFDNPHVKHKLYDLGLRPETAFGCALNFLVRPNEAVQDMFKEEFDIMDDPSILKIGIQIRTGDEAWSGAWENMTTLVQDFHKFFACAQSLEEQNQVPGRRVVWFLLTDCLALRQQAHAYYGDKILTRTDNSTRLGHSTWWTGADQEIFMTAVGENWLMGMTDFQVISRFSGYGRTGALRSMRWKNIYSLNQQAKGEWESCLHHQWQPSGNDHREMMGDEWYGI